MSHVVTNFLVSNGETVSYENASIDSATVNAFMSGTDPESSESMSSTESFVDTILAQRKGNTPESAGGGGNQTRTEFTILFKDNVHYVYGSTFELFSFFKTSLPFCIWLNGLSDTDTVVLKITDSLTDAFSATADNLTYYLQVFNALLDCKAKVIFQADSLLGASGTYMALCCDELEFGEFGQLSVIPLRGQNANEYSKAMIPFVEYLTSRGIEKGMIPEGTDLIHGPEPFSIRPPLEKPSADE